MKVQARMEDKVKVKNLKSLLAFFLEIWLGVCLHVWTTSKMPEKEMAAALANHM